MSGPIGNLCIVLHGHLPYVLHHGHYPHGEAWLFEAAAETYLPILDMIGEVALMQKRPALTIGLTPILLEQLAHDRFKAGFVAYLHGRVERAEADAADFAAAGDKHAEYLARRWVNWHLQKLEHFERIGRDIPGEFAQRFREGHVQILTSNATHCYMPLVLNDEMLAAQMKCGVATSERILGVRPRGMWLPECAYRPHWGHWLPSVLYDNARDRPGVETFIEAAGVTHFFVESHLVQNATALGHRNGGFHAGGGWRPGQNRPLEPVGVVSGPREPAVFAFARHPEVSEQVWSGSIGYPADGAYLEFHRKQGERGLRYHKITSTKTPLSAKDPYFPDDIPAKLYEHAHHFCDTVKRVLWDYHRETGRRGTVVASFDAELFGHWWFEGVSFLRDVVLTLANEGGGVELKTAEEVLVNDPPDKVMRLPEGSWGENGDHTVWMNDKVKWVWEIEYRAEGTLLRLLHSLPWKENADVRGMLERVARQLLLLQASDWPFVIHTGGAVDYGIERLAGHATKFNRLADIAEHVAAGGRLDDLQKIQVADADAHDDVFREIDLDWWMR